MQVLTDILLLAGLCRGIVTAANTATSIFCSTDLQKAVSLQHRPVQHKAPQPEVLLLRKCLAKHGYVRRSSLPA